MKQAFSIVKTTLAWLIVALSVFMMVFTVISVTTFNRNDRELFGYRAYIVKTDSMMASGIHAGDLIFVKDVDPSTLREGDIITFISQNHESFGETVTHSIMKRTEDVHGQPGFITYGTTTGVQDDTVVTFPYVMGKYESRLPGVGTFFNFLKTPQGYFTCIFIPFFLLILQQGLKCIKLFRRYKAEQMEEMNAEKSRLEEERAENAKMLEELLALKAQLQQRTETSTPSEQEQTHGEN